MESKIYVVDMTTGEVIKSASMIGPDSEAEAWEFVEESPWFELAETVITTYGNIVLYVN